MKKVVASGLSALSLILTGCGGSGGGGSSSSGGAIDGLSGTVAVGAPLSNAKVYIIGQSCNKTGSTNSNGYYSLSLAGCEGPYLVRAVSTIATIHSVATEDDIGKNVNISPLTELIAAKALGDSDLRNAVAVNPVSVANNLAAAKTQVKQIIQPLLDEMGVSDIDIINTAFSANGLGLDKVLDVIDVQPSGVDMALSIKGNAPKVFPSDVEASTLPAAVTNLELDSANAMAGVLAEIKALMSSANTCFKNANKTCFVNLSSSDFIEDGYEHTTDYAGNDWWTDNMEIESSYYVKLSNPILFEIDDETTPTVAHAMIKVTEVEDGQEEGSEYVHVKIKKEAGSWKIAGNGMSENLDLESGVVMHGGDKYRVIQFAHDDINENYAGLPASYSVNFHGVAGLGSLTFTKTQDVSGYQYYAAPGANQPACAAESLYCASFVDVTNKTLPNFIKLTVGGVVIYRSTPIALPEDSSFPSFTNVNSALCGTGLDTSTYQTSLNFTIPSGQSLDGYNIGPIYSTIGFDFSGYDWSGIEASKSFSLDHWMSSGAMDVSSFNASVTSIDARGFYYMSIYGCEN